MRYIFEALAIGAVAFNLAWPAGAPNGDSGGSRSGDSRSLEIGLGIEVGAEWISLNGSWALVEDEQTSDGDSVSAGKVGQVRIASFPNVVKRAQRGVALVRALRTATVCTVKLWLAEIPPGYEGREGR